MSNFFWQYCWETYLETQKSMEEHFYKKVNDFQPLFLQKNSLLDI